MSLATYPPPPPLAYAIARQWLIVARGRATSADLGRVWHEPPDPELLNVLAHLVDVGRAQAAYVVALDVAADLVCRP